jgi:hypothetical protein
MSGAWYEAYGKWHNVCYECNGDGELEDEYGYIFDCPRCKGSGKRFEDLEKGVKLSDDRINK